MTGQPSPTPVDVVRRYLEEVYHQGRAELIRELTADPLVRHDPGATVEHSHQRQIDRIHAELPGWRPLFTAEVLTGDAEFATLVWTATGRDSDRTLSGIEVFRVRDGRITEVWNAAYSTQPWT